MLQLRLVDASGVIQLFGDFCNSLEVVEVVKRDDGVIELRPHEIDASQKWFWSEQWQAMERAADEDFANGRVIDFPDIAAFNAYLDTLAESDDRK